MSGKFHEYLSQQNAFDRNQPLTVRNIAVYGSVVDDKSQEKEREAVAKRSPQPHPPRQVCNSPSVVSDVTCVKANTPPVWELGHLSTLRLSWNTFALKSSNSPETLHVITKRVVSYPVTSPLLWRMTKSWTVSLVESPLLVEVFFQTSTPSFFPRSRPSKHAIGIAFSTGGARNIKTNTGTFSSYPMNKDTTSFVSFFSHTPFDLFPKAHNVTLSS